MLLAIDAGNTNIVFALYDDGAQKAMWRIHTQKGRTADEYAAALYPLFTSESLQFDAVSETIISSVVPDESRALTAFCEKTLKSPARFIGSDITDFGIENTLPKPEEVGADRLMNAIAVVEHYQYPAVVIDFGTSTNFDVVDANGAFCGGILAPGVNLSVKALHDAAAKLPKINIQKPDKVVGNDTVSAMQSGLYFGYVSMIEGLITRITYELGQKPYIIATGGLAQLFSESLPVVDEVDNDLTMKGLLHIHTRLDKA